MGTASILNKPYSNDTVREIFLNSGAFSKSFGDDRRTIPSTFSNVAPKLKDYESFRNEIIQGYMKEIVTIIAHDEYIDGEISKSAIFMKDVYTAGEIGYVREALMQIYLSNIQNTSLIEGILVMISSVPYDAIAPQGQIMALGMLSNKKLELRDRAIQCYEKWNSKKGLEALKTLECHPKWLQKYVDKVIMYIERDGIE